jgi:pyruvate,orthophosphate dikinase
MSYVSCSPFRVPIARLAAAQAAIEDAPKKAAKPKKTAVMRAKKVAKKSKKR